MSVSGLSRAKTLAFSALAVALFLLLVGLISKAAAYGLGIRDPAFRYENQIRMWQPDPIVGFRNKDRFDDYAFGTVHITTDEHGFRGRGPTHKEKQEGVVRIVGVGDSVMWGTGVNREDSLLGKLRSRLDEAHPSRFEVINAGVVGYSTLLEGLMMEERLQVFSPDIVLVNFCANDMLPTEDPFRAARSVYIDYMTELVHDRDGSLAAGELRIVEQTIAAFGAAELVEPIVASASPATQRVHARIFLEIPVQRMIDRLRDDGARPIFLLIPPRNRGARYVDLAARLRELLTSNGVEYLDFATLLRGSASPASVRQSRLALTLRRIPLLRDLMNIVSLRRIERVQDQEDYIDFVHPSRRGNEIIADAIFEQLSATGP